LKAIDEFADALAQWNAINRLAWGIKHRARLRV
jgi:hypothetical protein